MYAISDQDYEFIRKIVYHHSRINLGQEKKMLVTSRLAKRLRTLQLSNYSDYCRLLQSPAGDAELGNLVDVISTNHTHFFRELKHFEFLQEQLFPRLRPILQRQRQAFRLWSAAASTGEEPYSLAITLAEELTAHGLDWRIEATDISRRVLVSAAEGIYADERLVQVRPDWLRRHFQKGTGDWSGHCRVRPELRERVRFQHLNLLQPAYPFQERFHVIFCRNVMIYFDRPTQEALVAKLTEQLLPGGYLMVGHSESLTGIRHSLRGVQPAIYHKAEAG